MISEVGYLVRRWKRSPSLPMIGVLSIALAMAVNAVAFSLVNVLFFRPLPVGEPRTLFDVMGASLSFRPTPLMLRYGDFEALERGLDPNVVTGAVASAPIVRAVIAAGRDDYVVLGEFVSPGYFSVLGLRPVVGQFAGHDATENDRVVIGERLWRTAFGGEWDVVGKAVRINGIPFVVGAVAPRSFRGLLFANQYMSEIWVPAPAARDLLRGMDLTVYAKIRCVRGTSPAIATAVVAAATRDIVSASELGRGTRVFAEAGAVGRLSAGVEIWAKRTAVWVMAAVLALLIIASINVAVALVWSWLERSGEIALRQALGASRRRILVELLIEPVSLSAIGGVTGLALAHISNLVLAAQNPEVLAGVTLSIVPLIDWRVAVFTSVAMGFASLVCGLWPARVLLRTDIRGPLSGGPLLLGGERRLSGDRLVLMVHLAATVVLLSVAAQLSVITIERGSRNLGFDQDRLLVAHLEAATPKPLVHEDLDLLVARLSETPSILRAAVSDSMPFGGEGAMDCGAMIGGDRTLRACHAHIGPSYFEVMGITDSEYRGVSDGVIVSAAAASACWPGQTAVGQKIAYQGRQLTVVGVVRNVDYGISGGVEMPFLYSTRSGTGVAGTFLLIRTRWDTRAAIAAVRNAVRDNRGLVAATGLMTFKDHMATGPLYASRVAAIGASCVAAIALAIAVCGLYASVARAARRRRRELAIRSVLGARSTPMLAAALLPEILTVVLGVGCGVCGTWVAQSALGSTVSQGLRLQWITVATVAGFVLGIALGAGSHAVRGAWAGNPAEVLREL
jgi:predicted permease